MANMDDLNRRIIACRACPRLVEWREKVGRTPPRSYAGRRYWSKPLTGFGDPTAPLMVVGLAPAAHGGNRTGRMFTGDRSATFLFRALFEVGLSTAPDSVSIEDGVRLQGCYLTAAVRCAPPANRPAPSERDACIPFLIEEIDIVRPATILALGHFAWDGVLLAAKKAGGFVPSPKPRFSHRAQTSIKWRLSSARRPSEGVAGRAGETTSIRIIGSYHPSRQNTFTGKLTMPMLVEVLEDAVEAG